MLRTKQLRVKAEQLNSLKQETPDDQFYFNSNMLYGTKKKDNYQQFNEEPKQNIPIKTDQNSNQNKDEMEIIQFENQNINNDENVNNYTFNEIQIDEDKLSPVNTDRLNKIQLNQLKIDSQNAQKQFTKKIQHSRIRSLGFFDKNAMFQSNKHQLDKKASEIQLSQNQAETLNQNKGETGNTEKTKKNSMDATNQLCLICMDKEPDAVFMECGHGGVCYDCSLDVWKTTTECFLCREPITQVLQIDLNSLGNEFIKVLSSTQVAQDQQESQ